MDSFIKETEGIYRLRIPFDTVYTSVFLIVADEGSALVDCATTADDVDGYIVPALAKLGYSLTDIKYTVLTHSHADHAGGYARVSELAPSMVAVTDERELFLGISTYAIPGHTVDFIGVFDQRSGPLISGDGLQGAGVDKYRTSTKDAAAYLRSLEKIRRDGRVENLLFSHAYEPWFTDRIFGRDGVLECIEECKKYVEQS